MSNKYPSQGVQLQLSISAVFTTIAALVEMNLPEGQVETSETTDINVAHGKTFDTTGLVDAGEFDGTGFMDPAGATITALTGYIKAPTPNALTSWKVIYTDPAPTNWTWSAIVKSFQPMVKMGEFLKFKFGGKVSGLITGW